MMKPLAADEMFPDNPVNQLMDVSMDENSAADRAGVVDVASNEPMVHADFANIAIRAGTRYRRRGVDPDGWVANYVETEQILSSGDHHLSFVQTTSQPPDSHGPIAVVRFVNNLRCSAVCWFLTGSVVMGTWGLIDADADATDGDQELDTILILTTDSYYAACYDDDTDRIVSYQRVPLCDLQSIELGPCRGVPPVALSSNPLSTSVVRNQW
ncbi:Phosphatidylinositide phosphatase SAC2 [Amphibalanus amphitrite]|uniref:Phosphatidylinositide phosphatase SAC2 n=1 Tax=Amphibalanus amphitrite TaxID=1232801 RepID=A0A6A4VHY6_AMPAM|nr:Phosphatidylinositide phosphatase SAC2 [Amphibalanus amphitrite]KAF0289959.1 Phosphatidylinositide phosphatase SAC2 [Amphibalanus amphitrite]